MAYKLALLLPFLVSAYAAPTNSTSYQVTSGTKVQLKNTPAVGVSFEFFAFPGYHALGNTAQCLANLDQSAGGKTPIRIGGTTQDRALYAPQQSEAVKYYVASPDDAPINLTYGPSFFDMAGSRANPTVIGLNRRLNQQDNSIAAARQARKVMKNLYAFELGNEPDFFNKTDPIAHGQTWSPALDVQSQLAWQSNVSSALGVEGLIQAGVYLTPPDYALAKLAPQETSSGNIKYVKDFCNHAYPQSACGGSKTDLATLMDHPKIVSFVKKHEPEVAAAVKAGRPVVLGETNSATCGGGGISPTFGAGLWLLDYVFQSVILGYERLNFHQGTIGNSPYSFWGQDSVYAPYYGAMFAANALNGVTSISELDSGDGTLAVYALYVNNEDQPSRFVVYDSSYHTSGDRPTTSVDLTGLQAGRLSTQLLTAPSAYSQQEKGEKISWAGVSYDNTTCLPQGNQTSGSIDVVGGKATVTIGASEALLLSSA